MKKAEQIQRIARMEEKYDRVRSVLDRFDPLLEEYLAVQQEIAEMDEYYQGKWRRDYEDDEKGKLPSDLKRGILSQDALYDLLCDNDELKRKIQEIE